MGRVFDLLIVDDDPGQLRILESSLRELGLLHKCHHCDSGQKALDFLHRRAPFEGTPRPHLILLDFNMPDMDGCEVLRQVKSDPGLRSIPVVMMSSSRALRDINACYTEYANAYVSKPPDLEGNLDLLRHLDQFWSHCELVPR
ncbi:MAG TPA: response regulator [Bryobacteraceae bacterium]|jgi:CheY-like chemotaxis protein|nr:response regulator [Bryobacteraceae bacterium]